MRTFISNAVITSAVVGKQNITGKAVDIQDNVSINFTVANDKQGVNRAIFIPESNLVITGNFCVNYEELATVDVYVSEVMAVVSLPELEPIADESSAIELASVPASTDVAVTVAAVEVNEASAETVETIDAEIVTQATPARKTGGRAKKSQPVVAEVTESELVPF
jgi:hypothetical protein